MQYPITLEGALKEVTEERFCKRHHYRDVPPLARACSSCLSQSLKIIKIRPYFYSIAFFF